MPDFLISASPGAERKRCFDPVVDARTRLLILGSLPGDASLAQQQYYGHKQNKFWQLMSAVTEVALVPLPYPARLRALLDHGVGLWDVVAQARREGSLDSNIRARADNDLRGLLADFPAIHTLAFNGGTAARLGTRLLADRATQHALITLPSSSPAYTLAYEEKLAAWSSLRAVLTPGSTPF